MNKVYPFERNLIGEDVFVFDPRRPMNASVSKGICIDQDDESFSVSVGGMIYAFNSVWIERNIGGNYDPPICSVFSDQKKSS